MRKEYYFKNNEFVIENFDTQKTFTSFLPSIAGKKGVPAWAFYVNRGQAMSSFGVQDKNGAILEFFPAYTAYQVVNKIGFRTFIKCKGKVHEIFGVENPKAKRNLYIQREQIRIEEINKNLGLKIAVTYFGLPNMSIASLVRKVEITNYRKRPIKFEVVDGLSQIFTPGTEHGTYKVMSNLLRSWMDVYNLDKNVAFYKNRASTGDSAEVSAISEGNFYVSFTNDTLIKPIVDPSLIFGNDKGYTLAKNFIENDVETILNSYQNYANKVPCGFTLKSATLRENETLRINTIIGKTFSLDALNELLDEIVNEKFIDDKQKENIEVVESMMKDVNVDTKNTLFNEYIKNTYLDNMLRGGYPFSFNAGDNKDYIYYLYSRRHGDPERDYNFFSISPEYYSQGNGNFRDICQNRRSDSMINRNVKDYNLYYFMNLIQLDGYNPLGINGATFELINKENVDEIYNQCFSSHKELMINLLNNKFTPGSIVNTVENYNVKTKVTEEEYLSIILRNSNQNIEAGFGEGFWIDPFTYLLDLLESYLSIYPDLDKEVLFDRKDYKYYESDALVQPRNAKIILTPSGSIRQYGALYHPDLVKVEKFNLKRGTNWAKDAYGNEVHTNLYSKIYLLAVNKFALLDNQGIGIEMEAGKPGWNDAMNGLPGLFGSGISETFELVRIVDTLIDLTNKYPNEVAFLPIELLDLQNKINQYLDDKLNDYDYWDKVSTSKEAYREILRIGIKGQKEVVVKEFLPFLNKMKAKLQSAIDKAREIGNGIYPTFLVYEVTKYENVLVNNEQKYAYKGYPVVKPLEFKLRELPKCLEGPARAYKVIKDKNELKDLYHNILNSDIYDNKLKMYKTSADLDNESLEIGRIRAFTKGWLERESNFMHMTYKYMYGLLKAELYDEFYDTIKTNMVCNIDAKMYGRSPLEASSFIATSNNPDYETHGQGFVARLSGTTAEMLSIYLTMMSGGKPFIMDNNELKLNLRPKLTSRYIKNDKTVSFTLLSDVKVTYIFDEIKDTFNMNAYKYELINDQIKEVNEVKGEDAIDVRNGFYKEIKVYMK